MTNKDLHNILYAEDEADIRAIAQIALEDIGGFSVQYCNTGKEVLEALKHALPDIILLDVMMPEMDGITTLQEIRKVPEFVHIPAIFMTAKIQPAEVAEYKKMGVIDVINKPFDPMSLAEQIKNSWNKFYE